MHWRGSESGQVSGHDIGVADEPISAATACCGSDGCSPRMSAATPATCGEAIDVPLIHTYRPPPLTTARFAVISPSQSPVMSVLDHPARMRPRPKTVLAVCGASPPGAATWMGVPTFE